MVEIDWVPCAQVLVARNWNPAIGGVPRTASRVASNVETSTPLVLGWSVAVVLLMMVLLVTGRTGRVVVTDGRAGTLGGPPSPDLPVGGRRCRRPGQTREGTRARARA